LPELMFSQALTANQVAFRPLQNWRFRRLPYPAQITVLLRATTVGARFSIMSGTTEIAQRSPVQGGGTAGVTPTPLNTPVLQFNGDAGDEIDLAIDEVAAGTPTVDGWVNVEPA
jgi:hypothetical protein